MIVPIVTKPVPLHADEAGVLRVGNTRVSFDSVLIAFNDGATPEEIVQQYDSLSLSEVYAVIGYYLEHKGEIDAYLVERRGQRERLRMQIEARFDPRGIRDRLLARRKQS